MISNHGTPKRLYDIYIYIYIIMVGIDVQTHLGSQIKYIQTF